MDLLIIGGTGFVSSHVLKLALKQGHRVWYVTRGHRPLIPGANPLIADRSDRISLFKALISCNMHFDAAIDCICFDAHQAEETLPVLARFTDRVISISTDSVYHPAFKKVPQDENGERYLEDGLYGAKKRSMEQYYLTSAPASLKWTLFRPPHMFGPGSELGCFPEHIRQHDLIAQMRSGSHIRLVGGGTYLLQPLYVGDLARAILEAIPNEKTFGEIFCIAGPDVIKNRDYYTMLGEILHLPVTLESIEEEGYLKEHPDCSVYLCDRVYDLRKMEFAGLTLPDTPLRKGLEEQVAYLLQNG